MSRLRRMEGCVVCGMKRGSMVGVAGGWLVMDESGREKKGFLMKTRLGALGGFFFFFVRREWVLVGVFSWYLQG